MAGRPSIVFLNRFYWPDVAATGQMLTDLAEGLAERGWDVTVITSRTGYHGAGGRLAREEVRRGVRVVRVDTSRFGRGRLAGRLADYLTYFGGALARLATMSRPDVVVPMSDPPLLVGPVLALGRARGFRTVYWLQDLYPHLAARLGVLREDGVAYRLAHALTTRMHRGCHRIVALGPQMARQVLAAGGREDNTTWVHNWADEAAIRPIPREENPFVRAHGLQDRFVVLYSGNAGRAHTFDAVLEAARRLRRDQPDVLFLFIGGGPRAGEIREAAKRDGLDNLRFLDYLPREELTFSLSAASCSLVTEIPAVAGLLVPSKTYGILASGRPLLFVGSEQSDVAGVVHQGECGYVIDPDDADGLVSAIRRLRDDPQLAEAMGRRARHAAEREFSRARAVRRWDELISALVPGPLPDVAGIS